MSLLSVTVKKARFICEDADQFNSYVTLKLQNVKSTTVTVKGANPCWEQDFLFETNNMNAGLLVEVWCKGFLWDRFLGYYYVPLTEVSYMNEEPAGKWVSLDSELEMRGADIIGTKKPTGHTLLIDCRLELPFDPENTEAADLQRKLEMLNNMMDQEARAEQARRQILYNIGHSGYSEDSDYTSDLNYPVGGQGPNSSASQFRTAANQLTTPQRSLETSRENSYERDDHQIPGTVGGRLVPGSYGNYGGLSHSPRYDEPYPEEGPPSRYSHSQQASESSEPLFYNSRPRHYKEHRRRKHTWDYEDSQDGWYSEGYDYPSTRLDETRIYSDTEYYPSTTTTSRRRTKGPHRRPSLERQMTLYDEYPHYTDGYNSDGRVGKMSATYPECRTDRYNEYYDTIPGYAYQDERYGQDDEDRQWDSGGKWHPATSIYYENKRNRKTLPERPASSIGIHRPDYKSSVVRQRSYESEELDYSGRRKTLQPQRRSLSRQEGGKRLLPTPNKTTGGRKLASLPATPSRQLPKTRTPSEENYYKSDYNEDYNYAYRSQDNLPQDTYTDSAYIQDYNQQQPQQQHQVLPTSTVQYPEIVQDNQYSSSYGQMDQYNQVYQQPANQDSYNQPYQSTVQQDIYDTAYQQPVKQDSYDQSYDQSYQTPQSKIDAYEQPYQNQKIDSYDQSYQNQKVETYDQSYQGEKIDSYDQSYPSQKADTYDQSYQNQKIDTYDQTYQTQKIDKFDQSYQTPQSKADIYDSSYKQDVYKDDYGSYDQQGYDETYQDQTAYPNTSQSNQQSFDKSGVIIEDNYRAMGYDHNNVQYQQSYDQTDYNGQQYDDYGAPVTSQAYDQNNVSNAYNQYQQDSYDSQYNITASTGGYQEIYRESYDTVPVSTQDDYQDSYNKTGDYVDYQQTPYSKEMDVPTSYQNDYQNQYEDSYQDSYDKNYQDGYDDRYIDNHKSERRQSEIPELSVTTPKGQTKANGYPSKEPDYNYQDNQQVSQLGSTRRKQLGKRDANALMKQNTDSLESRDDELKDSFETAVSSVSSSLPRKGYSEYSTAGESTPATSAPPLISSTNLDMQPNLQPTPTSLMNHMNTNMSVSAIVHTTANGKRLARTDSYQEDMLEEEDVYPEIIPKEPHRKDSHVSQQSQISQHSIHSQKPKLTRGESYASDHYPEDNYSVRRDSYAQPSRKDSFSSTTKEGFKPPLVRTDSYQQPVSRANGYNQNFTGPQPISRAESYQRGYFDNQESLDENEIVLSNAVNGDYKMREETLQRYEQGEEAMIRASRENSLVEPYKVTPPSLQADSPRGSVTKQASLEDSVQMDTPPRRPPEPPADEELLDMVGAAPVPTQLKERPEMSARQRWHWAYNQIIRQLNVSRKDPSITRFDPL